MSYDVSCNVELNLEVVECGKCGCNFGLTAKFIETLRDNHETFYCPNGHPRHFPGKSEKEKLRDELTRKQAALDQAHAESESQKRTAAAAKGEVTKIRNRIGKGVCPCCNRTFGNLARHMATKHPESAPAK